MSVLKGYALRQQPGDWRALVQKDTRVAFLGSQLECLPDVLQRALVLPGSSGRKGSHGRYLDHAVGSPVGDGVVPKLLQHRMRGVKRSA